MALIIFLVSVCLASWHKEHWIHGCTRVCGSNGRPHGDCRGLS